MYNLQEAYLGVYYDLDEGIVASKTMNSGQRRIERNDRYREENPTLPSGYPTGPNAQLLRQMAHAQRRGVKTKGTGVRESYDLYDLIFDYLLDEGYADTEESATVIMANMSEDWIDDICGEVLDESNRMERELEKKGQLSTSEKIRRRNVGWDRGSKARQQFHKVGYQKSKQDPTTSVADREELYYPYRKDYHKQHQINAIVLPSGRHVEGQTNLYVKPNEHMKTYVRGQLARRKNQQAEQLDLYDLIFDYLLDEGYADTEEAATVIMANMSEDWIDSIAEDVLEEGQQGQYQQPFLSHARLMSKDPKARMSPARRALEKSDQLRRTEPGSPRQKKQTKQARLMGQALHSATVLQQKQDKDRKRELGY